MKTDDDIRLWGELLIIGPRQPLRAPSIGLAWVDAVQIIVHMIERVSTGTILGCGQIQDRDKHQCAC